MARGGNRDESPGIRRSPRRDQPCVQDREGWEAFRLRRALVVVGDQRGRVGFGKGKAKEVPEAIRKATEQAKRQMIRVPLREGRTLHHDVEGRHGAGKVMMRTAPAGYRDHRRWSDACRVRDAGRAGRRREVAWLAEPLQHDPRHD